MLIRTERQFLVSTPFIPLFHQKDQRILTLEIEKNIIHQNHQLEIYLNIILRIKRVVITI